MDDHCLPTSVKNVKELGGTDESCAVSPATQPDLPANAPIDKDRLDRIRQLHPRAYEKWTEEEDARPSELFRSGKTAKQIAATLQRHPQPPKETRLLE